jgi:hypothetical protein
VSMILNDTPFTAEINAGWDQHLKPYHVVVVAAAFEARPGRPVVPAAEPALLHAADVFHGEPGRSSVRYEADFAPEKSRVDVLVNGSACAPGGGTAERVRVSLRVADVFKELVISGDRERGGPLGLMPGRRPFTRMPIVYERALGGTAGEPTTARMDVRNPTGIGYHGARSADPDVKTDAANVEYADGRSEPAGFGVIARHWAQRVRWAGTYDEAWTKSRCPLLPADFDPRYHQAAPTDQQSDAIRGGEAVELLGMTPEGNWRFKLPILDVPVHLLFVDRGESAVLRLDTVMLEPDTYRVTLTSRVKIPMVRNRGPIRQVVIGHITSGWWRAQVTRKRYRDPRGLKGRELGRKAYRV